jgi:oligopeptidase B
VTPNSCGRYPRLSRSRERLHTNAQCWSTPTTALQDKLFEEMKGRVKEDDSSVPAIDGQWAYYRRFREGGEYPIFAPPARRECLRQANAAHEQVLLDGDAMAKDCDYWDIRKVSHSPDHRLLALRHRRQGIGILLAPRRRQRRRARKWNRSSTPMASSCGARTRRRSTGWRATRMRGQWPCSAAALGWATDALVYREADPGFFIGVQKSQSRRSSSSRRTITPQPSGAICAPTTTATKLTDRGARTGVDYSVVDFDDRLLDKVEPQWRGGFRAGVGATR